MSYEMDTSQLEQGLVELRDKMNAVVLSYAQKKADELQTYAKKHAKWQNQTGIARRSLNAEARRHGSIIRISLAHGVEYGIYLEYGHTRQVKRRKYKGQKLDHPVIELKTKYAIIWPSIKSQGPKILKGMSGQIDKLDMKFSKSAGKILGKAEKLSGK